MAELMQVSQRQSQLPAGARSNQGNQYLTFSLGGETFAMEIRCIREVIQFGGLTLVPLMPDFIRGVINLRGGGRPGDRSLGEIPSPSLRPKQADLHRDSGGG